MSARTPFLTILVLSLLVASAAAAAGRLTGLDVTPVLTPVGSPVAITVHRGGADACGFRIATGEGPSLGPFGLPGASRTIPHTFRAEGEYTVRALGARHGSKPACNGTPAGVTVRVTSAALRATTPERDIRIASVTPDPVLIGGTLVIEGSGFGSADETELAIGSYGDTIPRVLGPAQIRSWTDTRIEVAPTFAAPGTHYVRVRPERDPPAPGDGPILEVARDAAFRNFEVSLPTPTITGYQPPSACPGSVLEIRGQNFTSMRGAFVLLWDKIGETRSFGITLNDATIVSWSDRSIRVQLPTDLPAYIAPGDRFRISLAERMDRGIATRGRGPESRLAERCGGADARAEGTSPLVPGPKLALGFELAPVNHRVSIGEDVVFGGTFDTGGGELMRRTQREPLRVAWRILRDGRPVARGEVTVRGRRAPLLVRAEAGAAGTYVLELEVLDRPTWLVFRPDLDAARVQILHQLDRDVLPERALPPGVPAPTPRGFERR